MVWLVGWMAGWLSVSPFSCLLLFADWLRTHLKERSLVDFFILRPSLHGRPPITFTHARVSYILLYIRHHIWLYLHNVNKSIYLPRFINRMTEIPPPGMLVAWLQRDWKVYSGVEQVGGGALIQGGWPQWKHAGHSFFRHNVYIYMYMLNM